MFRSREAGRQGGMTEGEGARKDGEGGRGGKQEGGGEGGRLLLLGQIDLWPAADPLAQPTGGLESV